MKPEALTSTRGRSRVSWFRPVLCALTTLVLLSCAAPGPDSESDTDLPFAAEMSEVLLGTESGNPTSVEMELGTESGNPIGEAIPDTESGTESGNPTRPPPSPVTEPEVVTDPGVPEVSVPVEVPGDPPVAGTTDMPDAPDANPGDSAAPMATAPVGTPGFPGTPPTNAAGCDASQCQLTAQQYATTIAAAQPEPVPFEQFTCTEAGTCRCESSVQSVEIVPAGTGCLVQGRWSCLVSAEQFLGCDAATPMACESPCTELDGARVADSMGRAVEVRTSACVADQCRFVLAADGECFVGSDSTPSLEPADCSLADEELLAP